MKTLWRALAAAMAGVFTVRYISPTETHHSSFFINFDTEWNLFELIPFSILGVLGALYGVFFIKCNLLWNRYRTSYHFANFPILETFILAFVTSLFAYFPNHFHHAFVAEATEVIHELTLLNAVWERLGISVLNNWSIVS